MRLSETQVYELALTVVSRANRFRRLLRRRRSGRQFERAAIDHSDAPRPALKLWIAANA